jgi:Cu(I)/Ag(I) efflux system membrane fusion protein
MTDWKHKFRVGGALLVLIVGLIVGFTVRGCASTPPKASESPAEGPSAEKKVQIWTCSMHPQIRQNKPGLCPICSMELVPVPQSGAEEDLGPRVFATSEAGKKLMDIQTAPVERKFVTADVRMVGKVDYDETRLGYITAWVPGRLDRLFVDFTGIQVRKGDHMVSLYSPELIAAQQELLQAKSAVKNLSESKLNIVKDRTEATVNSARERLRLWGLATEQIEDIEKRGSPTEHVTIYAPMGGVVIHKNAIEGMYVQTGTRIYTIADLAQVWVRMDAYESDLEWLRYGQEVAFNAESYPGETFRGRISLIDPYLDPKTRTVKVRVDVPNADLRLKPDMFVHAVVHAQIAAGGRVMDPSLVGKWICPMHPGIVRDAPGSCDICGMPLETSESLGYVSASEADTAKPLVIPATAPLVTGVRAVVYVELPNTERPTYEGREVLLGPRAGDYYIVRDGLSEGERVVTEGNFKIDSALQIQAKPSMMSAEEGAPPADEQIRPIRPISPIRPMGTEAPAPESAKPAPPAEQPMLPAEQPAPPIDQIRPIRPIGPIRPTEPRASAPETAQPAPPTEQPAPPAEAPRFEDLFRQIINLNLSLAKSLSADDEKAALADAKKLNDLVSGVDMAAFSHADHLQWMKFLAKTRDAIKSVGAAKDIKGLRDALIALSEKTVSAVEELGSPLDVPLYVQRCPMANGGKGALWLQLDKEVRNPYFGSAMFSCGGIIKTIPPKGSPR